MARIKRNPNARRRHKKTLKLAKGYRGARSKTFKIANQAVMRAQMNAYAHRKTRKRDFRRLWITRINAAARLNGISYSRLINGLKKANIEINRKMLSELAISDPSAFSKLAEVAKNN